MNAALTKISSVALLLMLILSAVFFLERTLFIDTAYYLFRMSQEHSFNVELNRWSAVIPELLPWLGMKLSAPASVILMSYSLAFWLLYAGIFYLMVFRFKKPEAGLTLILAFTLFLRLSWYHSVTETHQAVAWCLMLYAWLAFANPDKWFIYIPIGFVLCLLGFFSHPVSLFMQVFIIAWVAWDRKLLKHPGLWLVLISLVGLYLTKVALTKEDSYEGSFFSQLKEFPALLPTIHHSFGLKFLKAHFWDIYCWPIAIGWFMVYWYARQKEWVKLFLLSGGTTAFLLLTWVAYYHGDAEVMTEKNLMPLAVFIVLPFAQEIYKDSFFLQARWKAILITLVLVAGFMGIVAEGLNQRKRVQWLRELTEQFAAQGTQRGLVLKSELKEPFVGAVWALAHETLWYSAYAQGQDGVVTVFALESMDTPPTDLSVTDLFMSTEFWLIYNAFTLNTDYFKFQEGRYEPLRDTIRSAR